MNELTNTAVNPNVWTCEGAGLSEVQKEYTFNQSERGHEMSKLL